MRDLEAGERAVNGRDANGRFAKGNGIGKGHKPGPGRPKKKREDRYLEVTLTACTFADWRVVVERAVTHAKRGDYQARKWLSDYLIGPAVQRLALSGDIGVWTGVLSTIGGIGRGKLADVGPEDETV